MEKRGISPLIATVLILGFTIVIAALIMTWGMDFYKKIKEEQDIRLETELICSSKIIPVVKASCLNLLPYVKAEIQNNGEKEITSFLIRLKSDKETILKNFNLKINPYSVTKAIIPYKVTDGMINEIEFIPNVTVRDKERICSPFKFSTINCNKIDFTNLIGFWPMDEGSGNVVRDYVNGNDGNINGATWVDTKTGKGLSFDGTSYVKLSKGIIFNEMYTAQAFINPDEINVNTIIGDDQNFEFSVSRCAGCCRWINSYTSPIKVKEWSLRSCVHDGDSYAAYTNYILGDDNSAEKVLTSWYPYNTYFGKAPSNTGGINYKGVIDWVAFFNKPLTQEEINEIYNALK